MAMAVTTLCLWSAHVVEVHRPAAIPPKLGQTIE
jgi:hypothetical protein